MITQYFFSRAMTEFSSPDFWIAVMQIVAIDVVLSGDNAIVIALACRSLPPELRRRGIFWGVFGAVGLRVVLTLFAAALLGLPFLKLVGGVLLLWIGVKLLLPDGEGEPDIAGHDHLWAAVKTIIVADFVMSVDNVIAVAGASHGSVFLLVFGLLVSIPLIVWSSQLIMHLMERFPIIVWVGGGLLGYVAGNMMLTDPAVVSRWPAAVPFANVAGGVCAMLVVALGWLITRRARQKDIVIL